MLITIFITFFSLIGLIILHEFGHFILAKRFGVRVEEFGIFLPPRLIGKKIGETIYSLNLLPFGAFVRLYGEEDQEKKEVFSFSQKPIWQRAIIVIGGVVSFWLISAILLIIVMGLGVPVAISDEESGDLINPKVQVAFVAPNSTAEVAGIKTGDTILSLRSQISKIETDKIKQIQEFIETNKGREVILAIERKKEVFEISLNPRVSPPEGEGAMGVALVRTAIKSYPWYQAPIKGIEATFKLTLVIFSGLFETLKSLIFGKGLPQGAQMVGPVGIGAMMIEQVQLGINYYLNFLALISVYLAVFNLLPLPALDGGKLVFLGIEAVRKKPLPLKVEQQITTFFFFLLLALMFFLTIKDIARLF